MTECADCGEPLVPAPPAGESPAGRRWAAVGNYSNLSSAHLASQFLRSEGFEAELRNQFVVGVNWLYTPAVGGIPLEVPTARADEASVLLDESAAGAAHLEEHPQELEGPVDEDELLRAARRKRLIAVVALALLFPPAIILFFLLSRPQRNTGRGPQGPV